MSDEELSVMMAAAVADDAGHEADVPAASTRPTKQRLRLNKAACERLIMAPFLLDPIIGQDIRDRRDAVRSLRLQEAAERKREAVQKALRTAIVVAKAIARMRSRATVARDNVAAARSFWQILDPPSAVPAAAKLPVRKPRKTREGTIARLRNLRVPNAAASSLAQQAGPRPCVEGWYHGSLQTLYEIDFAAEPQPEPEDAAIRDPAATQRDGDDDLEASTSTLGARTSSNSDYTGEEFDTEELVQQFLVLLVSAKPGF